MFKRGDIVKIVRGYYGSINDPDVGKVCVVWEARVDECDSNRYGIVECSTGLGSAWWHEDRLEFIREGGEEAIRAAMEKRKERLGEE